MVFKKKPHFGIITLFLSLLLCLIVFWGCGKDSVVEPRDYNDYLTIGLFLPYSGDCGAYGSFEKKAVELALKQVNAAGGILGQETQLVFRDTKTDPDYAEAIAREIIEDYSVVAVLGAEASEVSEAILNVTNDNNVIQLSGTSTDPSLINQDVTGNFFRTIPSDYYQGEVMAIKAHNLGYDTASVVYINNSYGSNLTARFVDRYRYRGGHILETIPLNSGQNSYINQIHSLLNHRTDTTQIHHIDTTWQDESTFVADTYYVADSAFFAVPKLIVLIAYPQTGATFLRDWIATGYNTQWMFSDALKAIELIENVGASHLEGAIGLSPFQGGTNYERFKDAFEAEYNIDPREHRGLENWYDAMMLLALAIEKAGSLNPDAIKDSMLSISRPPGTVVNFDQYQYGLEVIQTDSLNINYEGASGSVDFDQTGEITSRYEVWRIQGGRMVHDHFIEP
ncbi:ABC transporter substrate-binding protein [bacterium]|nr:ABC transporter substrate-binding protein [bacterium]